MKLKRQPLTMKTSADTETATDARAKCRKRRRRRRWNRGEEEGGYDSFRIFSKGADPSTGKQVVAERTQHIIAGHQMIVEHASMMQVSDEMKTAGFNRRGRVA